MTTSSQALKPGGMAPEIAYLALDLAQQRHGKPLSDLPEEMVGEILETAHRRFDLECRALASVEGLVGQVPASTLRDAEDKIRQRYENVEELRTDLARNGLDAKGLSAALHHNLRVEAVLAHIRQQAPAVAEVDARLYYHAHRKDFELPETRSARHLLVTINPDYPENTEAAARHRIGSLRKQLARAPERFAELAQRHSECPTALQGGQLGRLRRGGLYPALDQALFALAEGTLSQVLRSPLGLHLLRCERIHSARIIEESQALSRIRVMLTQQRQIAHEKAWLESL